MGWSLSWAALRGGDVQRVCTALSLRLTGQREEIAESPICGTPLPTGWYLTTFNQKEIEDDVLQRLSQSGEVVSCFVEDHVMFSSASLWKDGRQVWRVVHDGGEKGVQHIETTGNLPPEYETIRKRLFATQEKEVDGPHMADYVYDIPAELAKALTGYRHDQEIEGTSGEIFQVLEHAAQSGGFISRLFGKKA